MPRCPNCFVPMTRVEEDGLKIFNCLNCFGHWMAYRVLRRRTQFDVEQGVSPVPADNSLPDLAEIVSASHSEKKLRCPQCEKVMTKERFHAMIPVTIDRCKPCNTVWLDTGEFSLIRLLWKELALSDDPEIVRRRDKVATTLAGWETRQYEEKPATDIHEVNDLFDFLGYILRRL